MKLNIPSIDLGILESILVVLGFMLSKYFLKRVLAKARAQFGYNGSREKVYNKVGTIILFFLMVFFLIMIWGIDRHEIVYFASSVATIIGVAFFAQWSVLSNITSSFILFFNHPIRIGEEITILEKEFEVSGRVTDIGVFFMTIENNQEERTLIPTNLFLQKISRTKKLE
jgi:small-conductance mechanosensitive channel